MKQQIRLVAGCLFLLASCGSSDSNTQQQLQQHIIDSTVNAKLAQREAENAAKNDSTLKAMEAQKADTMEKQKELGEKKNTHRSKPDSAKKVGQ